MSTGEKLSTLIAEFAPANQATLRAQIEQYDELLGRLPVATRLAGEVSQRRAGILALNGASGAGQSYVMARVQKLLEEREIALPRIYLLATRPPRPGEGYQDPYIFVKEIAEGFQDIYHPAVTYSRAELYYCYQSRPGAANAILLADMQAAQKKIMYLETVVPTLLHIKQTEIAGIPPWGDDLQILYLVVPTGSEWVFRLLNREPGKLQGAPFQAQILGRTGSSLEDMQIAVANQIPVIFNRYNQAEQAAEEILAAWGLS
ncbi:MAG: hypothetical protein U9Q70_07410 [Chloroflexota bacterium]|nr:hypothetical protein [Chloroflexota bacterium]